MIRYFQFRFFFFFCRLTEILCPNKTPHANLRRRSVDRPLKSLQSINQTKCKLTTFNRFDPLSGEKVNENFYFVYAKLNFFFVLVEVVVVVIDVRA